MSQTPPSGTAAPNPAMVAFFRSTRWKLLVAADVIVVLVCVAAYVFTSKVLAFAPVVPTMGLMAFSIVRAARSGATPSDGADDQLVR